MHTRRHIGGDVYHQIDLPSGHVAAASFPCWLTCQVNCSNTFTHMFTCTLSDCHLCSVVLPLPHFVLPVHHCYSSSAGSWKNSSGTLLSVCVKGFRPAAWRHFPHPPLSSSDPPCVVIRQLRRCTAVACGWVRLCMCGGVTVYLGARHYNTFTLRKIYFSVSLHFFLFPVGGYGGGWLSSQPQRLESLLHLPEPHKRTFFAG